ARRTTDVEGTHGQLSTRLTDRLGSDDADRFADVDLMATGKVTAVALGADTVAGFTADWRTHDHFVDAVQLDEVDPLLINQGTGRNQNLFATRLEHVACNDTTQDSLTQRLNNIATFDMRRHVQALLGAAVGLGHNQILRNVNQTASQVTGVGGLQCGIRQTLTSTVGGDEVLEYVQTFTEVRGNRRLDDGAVRLGHQATHTGQLTDLGSRTTGARVSHHEHGVEGVLLDFLALAIDNLLFRQVGHHRLGHFVVGLGPKVNHLVVLLALGDQAGGVLAFDFLHFLGGCIDDARLLIRDDEIVHADGNAGNRRIGETGVHQLVGKNDGVFQANGAVAQVDQLGDRLLLHRLVDHVEWQAGRHDLEQKCTTDGGVDDAVVLGNAAVTILDGFVNTYLHPSMQRGLTGAEHPVDFLQVSKYATLALGIDGFTGHVVQTQNHVLRRHDERLAVGGRENVVGGHHQRARFQLGLEGQRNVNGHLVTVEVGVVRSTHQRVQLDRLTFDQNRLECLDTQTVQSRSAVEQHGMFSDDFGKNVPNLGQLALDHLLGGLDGGRHAAHFQLAENERLEQLQGHLLRQTA